MVGVTFCTSITNHDSNPICLQDENKARTFIHESESIMKTLPSCDNRKKIREQAWRLYRANNCSNELKIDDKPFAYIFTHKGKVRCVSWENKDMIMKLTKTYHNSISFDVRNGKIQISAEDLYEDVRPCPCEYAGATFPCILS